MVILIRSSRPYTRCPQCPHAGYDSPKTFPIPHTTKIDPWIDRSHSTTNTTKFYNKTLSYWFPDHYRSFPDRADFQDVSTMLPRLHEPTMPMSTIFQIVEIGTARSVQCDLGFRHHFSNARVTIVWSLWRHQQNEKRASVTRGRLCRCSWGM